MYHCEICNLSIKDDSVYLFPCGHIFDMVTKFQLIYSIQKCIIKSLEDYKLYIPEIGDKLEKIDYLQSSIVKLEKRKNSSRISAELEKRNVNYENKDIWNSITGLFAGKHKGRDSMQITFDEMGKLNNLKAYIIFNTF